MHSLIQVREHYGFSQANLAIYLSISTSLLKMVEQGKRELPFDASIKLARLQSFAFEKQPRNNQPDALTIITGKRGCFVKELHTCINRFEKRVRKNQLLLANMQVREKQSVRRLQLINQLSGQVEADEEGRKDTLWLELQELEAKDELTRYGQEAQAILQWRTDCYLLSIEQAQKALAAYT